MKVTVAQAKYQLSDLFAEIDRQPEVLAAQRKVRLAVLGLDKALHRAKQRFQARIQVAEAALDGARAKSRPAELPTPIVPVVERLCRGVNWGPRWRCLLFNQEFNRAIISQPCYSGWAGRGSRESYKSNHRLIDLNRMDRESTGMELMERIEVAQHDGRLPTMLRALWIAWCRGKKNVKL